MRSGPYRLRLEILVTTQHTEHEHNDEHDAHGVDETVAAQQHTPDTSVTDEPASSFNEDSSTTDVSHNDVSAAHAVHNDTTSISEHSSSIEGNAPIAATTSAEEIGNTIPEHSTSVNVEGLQAPMIQQEASPEKTEQPEEAKAPVASAQLIASETIDAVAAPVFVADSETVVSEIVPATEGSEEAVRPFTSFIEEFHQAQAQAEAQAEAHLSASLQAAEGFSEFTTPEMDVSAVDQLIPLEEALPPIDFGEGSAFVPSSDGATTVHVADVNTQLLAEAAITEESQRVAAVAETSRAEEVVPVTQRPERPVSPLLRPALRPRPARHSVTRHRDESTATSATPATTAPLTPAVEIAATTQPTQEVSAVPEQPKEASKPPRRYRFDRPTPQVAQTSQVAAPVSKPASETPASTNNNPVLTPPPATQTTPTFARVEENQTLSSKTPTLSTPTTSTVGTTQSGEPASMESTSTISSPTERHRHNSERQERHPRREHEKEQTVLSPVVVPTSVADITIAVVSESKAEEVAPEDMPPLEYAELQKANSSRRRRRHRTATPGTPVAKESVIDTNSAPLTPSIPLAPLAPVAPITSVAQNGTPVKPPVPSAPIATSNNAPVATPYTITSGYTVGQMNQGNEESGPFMGPEPSPARGSVNTTRDGRTVRVESQPQRSAPYQTRATEGMLPVAAMNHFANIVSQAIQTQSDRMVTELRRANQAPTNVSVSLPPFPSTERVGVFVDVANLLYSARTQRIAIDFGKLLDFLRGNRRLIRAHAYCPTSPQPGDEQMFLTAVKGLGYRITTKNYKTFASGAKKADLDLDLCMDVVRIVDGGAVDCIVLVSGDSDFMPMLDYCSDHGVRVEVAAFDEAMSATLRQSCDLFVNLSMLEEIRA
ncbi:MAG: hypothetical protein NVS4B1_32230 [Ktedonobacteraceae bacterium]